MEENFHSFQDIRHISDLYLYQNRTNEMLLIKSRVNVNFFYKLLAKYFSGLLWITNDILKNTMHPLPYHNKLVCTIETVTSVMVMFHKSKTTF